MGQRLFVAAEAPVGRQRDAHGGDPRRGQADVVLLELERVGDPQADRIAKRGVHAREVQVPRPAGRIAHVAHRAERHADQQVQPPALGLDEGLNHDVCRHVVGGGGARQREGQHRQGRPDARAHEWQHRASAYTGAS